MISLLVDVHGPVVIIVTIGAFALPRLGVDPKTLSTLAFWVLGPAFVFDLFAQSNLSGGLVARLVLSGLAGMVAAGLLSLAANRIAGSTGSVTAASVMTSAYGNVGNAGLAITSFALGPTAPAAAGVLMLTVNVTGITLGVALAEGQQGSIRSAIGRSLRTPMTVAAGAAVLLNLTNVTTPLALDRAVGLLAGAMIPVMLLGLGGQLARTTITEFTADLAISSVAKLLVAPTAAGVVALALGLGGDDLGAVVLQSAMPPAVFCLAVALERDLEPERVTTAVVALTILSIVTLPMVLFILDP